MAAKPGEIDQVRGPIEIAMRLSVQHMERMAGHVMGPQRQQRQETINGVDMRQVVDDVVQQSMMAAMAPPLETVTPQDVMAPPAPPPAPMQPMEQPGPMPMPSPMPMPETEPMPMPPDDTSMLPGMINR